MILNEGTTCKTLTTDIAVEKPMKELDEDLEEKTKDEEGPDDAWKFKLDDDDRFSLHGWVYRGEGNANLVLALPCERKVVRFRKSSRGEASPDGGRARTTREVEFLRYVISGFLGDYVQPPETLVVNRDDLVKVSRAIRSFRPEYRKSKEIVENYATIFTDYAFLPQKITTALSRPRGPTFCVEIKPKQGFRNEMDEEFKKCTYCLTQYYKLKNKAIKSRSKYCPFDLFSCEPERMKKSLRDLLDSPQNNLKIFRDGVIMYDSDSRLEDAEKLFAQWFANGGLLGMEQYLETFYRIVNTALLREFSAFKKNTTVDRWSRDISYKDYQPQARIDREIVSRAKKVLRLSDDGCNFDCGSVPLGSVLGRILLMQQLPYHGTDIVYKIYSRHFETLNDDVVYSQMIRMCEVERKKVSVRNGKKKKERYNDLAPSKAANSDNNENENNKIKENGCYPVTKDPSIDLRNNNNREREEVGSSITIPELEALQNYLLVTTARDCSILMAFQEIDSTDVPDVPPQSIVQANERLKFVVNIGVLDLDPKTIHCVEKHRQRDTNVLISLTSLLENELDLRNQ